LGKVKDEGGFTQEGQGWKWLWLRNVKVGGGFSWGASRLEGQSWGRSRLEGQGWGRSRLEVASSGEGQGWRWVQLGKVKVEGGFG